MAYNTGNPLGSTDFRDLSDNAQNFDNLSNGSDEQYPDRFGVPRLSFAGMETRFSLAQSDRAERFDTALMALGYVWIGDYAAGIEFTERNQYTVRAGSQYRVAPSVSLPYTLTGDWATDQPNLVLVESAGSILSELGQPDGATKVGTPEGTVQDSLNNRLRAGIDLASTNLDTLGSAAAHGLYYQAVPADGTLARGYPIASFTGSVLVSRSRYGCQQEATSTDGRKWLRGLTATFATNGPWAPWFEVTLDKTGTIGQVLVAQGSGAAPAWRAPNSTPAARSSLKIVYPGTTSPTIVTAAVLTVADSGGNAVLLTAFNQSATEGQASGVVNSLDTGTWASSTVYNLFAVYNPTSSTRGLLWSLSATAPTLPSGFTHFARVGANITASGTGGRLYQGTQWGNVFFQNQIAVRQIVAGAIGTWSVTAPTYAAVSLSGLVPPTAAIATLMLCSFANVGTAASFGQIAVANVPGHDGVISSNPPPFSSAGYTSNGAASAYLATSVARTPLFTTNIYVASTGTGAALRLLGWEDNL